MTREMTDDWTTGMAFHEVGTEFEPDFRCGSCADAVRLRRVGESIVDLLHAAFKDENAGKSTSIQTMPNGGSAVAWRTKSMELQ